MEIARIISVYDKSSEVLKEEIAINIELSKLKKIFKPSKDDPLMYNPYTVSHKEADQILKFQEIKFDLNDNIYQLDCFQV